MFSAIRNQLWFPAILHMLLWHELHLSILPSAAFSSCPWHSRSNLKVENFSDHYDTSCLRLITFARWECSRTRLCLWLGRWCFCCRWMEPGWKVSGVGETVMRGWRLGTRVERFRGWGEGCDSSRLGMGEEMQKSGAVWGDMSAGSRQSWCGHRAQRKNKKQVPPKFHEVSNPWAKLAANFAVSLGYVI